MKTVACIGVGNRGSKYLLELKIFHKKEVKPVAICDIVPAKLDRFGKKYKIAKDMRFSSDEDFFNRGPIADGLIISTPDREHFKHAKRALEVGYKIILLEKPVSKDIEETKEIARLAEEKGAKVIVCHVLRYSNYYLTLKNAAESGALGRVISVEQRENVGYFHFAHSYVRGEWHNEADSSPSILAKCCHDLDLIYWFAGSKPVSVDSYGDLFYFNRNNAPAGATEYCMQGCKCQRKCPYDAEAFYITDNVFEAKFIKYMPTTVFGKPNPTRKEKRKILRTGAYGKCVFLNDNDVCDHQEVNILFENGVSGRLTMTAFGERCERETRIVGTKGEVVARNGKIVLEQYGIKRKVLRNRDIWSMLGHIEGDIRTIHSFASLLTTGNTEHKYVTYIDDTVVSHQMAHDAEISRKAK